MKGLVSDMFVGVALTTRSVAVASCGIVLKGINNPSNKQDSKRGSSATVTMTAMKMTMTTTRMIQRIRNL